MSIRGLIVLLLLVGAAGLAWQQRDRLQAWAGSAAGASQGASRAGAESLRKCVNGQQVTYSNVDCPTGAKAQAVTGGTVTVVPGTPVAKPAEAASGPTALHKALDITRDDTLRDKIMERQMEGAR